jgi:hypothetical protein
MTTSTLFALTLSLTLVAACGAQSPHVEERQGAAIADPNYMQSVIVNPQEFPSINTHKVDSGPDFSMDILTMDDAYQNIYWSAYQSPPSDKPYDWIIATNWPMYPDNPSELAADLASGFASIHYDGGIALTQGSRTVDVGVCNGIHYYGQSHYYLIGGIVDFQNGVQMLQAWHSEPGNWPSSPCGIMPVVPEYHYEWIVRSSGALRYPDTLVPDPNYGDSYFAYRFNTDGTVASEGSYKCPQKVVRSSIAKVHLARGFQYWDGDADGTRFCIAPANGPAGYPNVYMLLHTLLGPQWVRVPETLRHPRWNDLTSSNALFHVEPWWSTGQGQDSDQITIPATGVMAMGDPARANPWHVYELDFVLNSDGSIKYYGWMDDSYVAPGHVWATVTAGPGGP